MRVLATYSIKGGVGKTSAAVNLAYLAACDGEPTLLWDLDPQGSATFLLRVRPKVKGGARGLIRKRRPLDDAIRATDFENLDMVPADLSYRHLDLALGQTRRPTQRLATLLRTLSDEYAYVVLDCAPSLSLVSESIFAAADALLVPMIPTTLSARTLGQLVGFLDDHAKKQRPEVLSFFSLSDRRKRLHRDVMASLHPKRVTMLDTAIPSSTDVERMGARRAPVSVFAPRSAAARGYAQLWFEVRDIVS
ncbi:MAG TPA: ParA family protein [Acidimicrobiales bacterium]|nr:ParA family protein [Acidimicrobiales bacterium]